MTLAASEDVRAKAARYLLQGRMRILSVRGERVYAEVVGSHEQPYSTGITGERGWCNCPSRHRCAHVEALELVVGTLGQRLDLKDTR